jgi:hypothetical protein
MLNLTNSSLCLTGKSSSDLISKKSIKDEAPVNFPRVLSYYLLIFALCSTNSKLLEIS